MTFVWLMAAREIRASWRRLLFFFACVAVGVGAIVTLRSIIDAVRSGLTSQSRALVAADVAISTNRPWTPETRRDLDRYLATLPVTGRQETIEVATMVRPAEGVGADAAKMVELRGVESGFPFYGAVTLDRGTYSHALVAGHGALVRPELLAELGLSVGDRLLIGGVPFTIRGVIAQEPGRRVGAFSFGSRVMVDLADLRSTGLLGFGSRANYEILLRMPDRDTDRAVAGIRDRFRDRFINARSYRQTEDQIGDDLQRAENYLSLVGFVILVLGGIGVWSVTRVFVRQKIRSVAILKCLGATTRQVLAAYVLQVVFLGIAGSGLGVGAAAAAVAAIPPRIGAAFGVTSYGLTLSAVAQGAAVGLLVSLLFSLVPLLEVRRVKPLLLIRGASAGVTVGWRGRLAAIDWTQVVAAVIVAGLLVLVAAWQAASLKVGAIVCGGFAAITLVLNIAAAGLVRVVRPMARVRWFPLRHAVLSLGRPGNQTRVILLAVGLGSFFVIGVRALQTNLLDQFSLQLSSGGADLFLIDIQPSQVEDVRRFMDAAKAPGADPPQIMPVLRARVIGVRGRDTTLGSFDDVRRQGGLGREFTITYRDHLAPNETLADGKFWTGEPPLAEGAAPAEVSIEQSIHTGNHIDVGDTMRFDIAGRPIDARVTSVRTVRWADARNGGFMFVFRPGTFAHAPQTAIGIMKGPDAADARGRLQRDLVTRFPNVSVIDLREILQTVQQAIDNVTLAISIVGGVALLSGLLILAGAVAMTKFQRVYEAAILRTLGASTRTVAALLALEYSALGLLAGVVGSAGALGLTWAVSRQVLDLPWRATPGLAVAGAAATALLVAVVGVVSSADVLRRKPLGALRAE